VKWAALVLALTAAAPCAAAPAGRDVVSLNLCSDQYLALLAPERAAALTVMARDPDLSVVADVARGIGAVRADAEAVLALHPALVLAAPWGAQATLSLLEAHGVPVRRLKLPRSFDAIRATTREAAAILGVPARGEAMLAEMDRRLAAVRRPARAVRALAVEPRLWTAGPGSLTDAVLLAAGLVDAGQGRQTGLEALLAHPPDLLVTPAAPGFPSLATDVLDHPALAGVPRRLLPPALLICGGPWSVRAVELLAE
jgi:iron complex transport system substrate-binding protein